jgi:ATP-dependent DNA ligase
MLLLPTERLPEGPDWLTELKLDGYRALAIKSGGKVHLRPRNDNDFNHRYPTIVKALAPMPDETVIDGELVTLDPDGRPSFQTIPCRDRFQVPNQESGWHLDKDVRAGRECYLTVWSFFEPWVETFIDGLRQEG